MRNKVEENGPANERAPSTSIMAICGCVLTGVAAFALWSAVDRGKTRFEDDDQAITVVHGQAHPPAQAPAPIQAIGDQAAPEAASERAAARPARGGPDVADTRGAGGTAGTAFESEPARGHRIRDIGPALVAGGLRKGDLVVSVDGRTVDELTPSRLAELLAPGAVVDVQREGATISLRIGSHPL